MYDDKYFFVANPNDRYSISATRNARPIRTGR